MTPFQPRPVRFLGAENHDDWRVKRYDIHLPDEAFEAVRFEPGLALAFAALPHPATAPGRPGAAILIAHQGVGADYLVLAWWDRENELPVRIWLREDADWRPAHGGESFCVWDLGVLWGERQAWVRHMLSAEGSDLDAYLAVDATTD